MAAAVADFTPGRRPSEGKIKKAGREGMEIELVATNDVLAGPEGAAPATARSSSALPPKPARRCSPKPSASSNHKGLDMIVANDIADPTIGFEVDGKRGHADHRRRRTRASAARHRSSRSPP